LKLTCALAFQCDAQSNIPLLKWNVTFPDKPKPPQPPSVRRQQEFDKNVDFIVGEIT
jgi:hypothetical protein